MSLKLGGYLFYGPFAVDKVSIRKNQKPVLVALVSREGEPWNPIQRLITTLFSGEEGFTLAQHPDAAQWVDQCKGGELQAFLYDLEPESGETVAELANAILSKIPSA